MLSAIGQGRHTSWTQRAAIMHGSTLLSRWRSAWAASHPEEHDPDPIHLAGRKGEAQFQETLRALPAGTTFFNVFVGGNAVGNNGKQPANRPRGKNEIDAIVVTPQHLYVIEVKNFGGELTVSSDFRTCTHTNRDKKRECENPILANRGKAQVLAAHLLQRRIALPDNFIVTRVCFVNQHLSLSKDLTDAPDTIMYAQIPAFAKKLGEEFGKQKHGLVDVLSRGKTFTQGLLSMLGQLPTWDTIHLVGGEQLTGNCIGLRISGEKEMRVFGRPQVGTHHIHFKHNRSLFLQGVKATFGGDPSASIRGPGFSKFDAALDGSVVVFRTVGETRNSELPINEVTGIDLSMLP